MINNIRTYWGNFKEPADDKSLEQAVKIHENHFWMSFQKEIGVLKKLKVDLTENK